MSLLMAFFAGLIVMSVIDSFVDWLDAITDSIKVTNEERRAKLNANH